MLAPVRAVVADRFDLVEERHDSPLAVESPADSEMAGIRLRPAGAAAFLRDSPAAIGDLVAAAGWSHRHFAARFRAEVGLTPKAFARIARFEAAFAGLQTLRKVHWAEFALDCGYADQAHLVRDFRDMAGATPTEVFHRRAPDGLGLLDEDEVAVRR